MSDTKYEDIVEVTRFIRPGPLWWDGDYAENLWGITIVYKLNYITKTVDAKWAICAGENFNKKLGAEIALLESTPVYHFALAEVDSCNGLTNALVSSLIKYLGFTSDDAGVAYLDYETYHAIFKLATRTLKHV